MPDKCAECGTEIGEGTKHSILQHTIACFSTPIADKATIQGYARNHPNPEHGKRILQNLDLIK